MIKNTGKIIKSLIPQWKEFGLLLPSKLILYTAHNEQDKYAKEIKSFLDKRYLNLVNKIGETWQDTNEPAEKIIWSIWWQGEVNLPEVVQKSRKTLEQYSGEYKVILLCEANINDYISIPEYLLQLVEEKKVSFVHLADYIRVSILKKYGGIWLDATVYLTDTIPNWYLDNEFLSRHLEKPEVRSVANGRWSGYYMVAGKKESLLYTFLVEFYNQYFKDYGIVITYLLQDYLIDMAYRYFPRIKKVIDDMPYNNEGMKFLQNHMNADFDKDIWAEVCNNTILQKLSWKVRIEDNPNSFYHVVCR